MHIHKGAEIGNSERDVMLEMSFWGTRHLSIFWRVGWGGVPRGLEALGLDLIKCYDEGRWI